MTVLDCRGRQLDLRRVAVMGILNVTPDSFSDGGHFFARAQALAHAREMVEQGAAIIEENRDKVERMAKALLEWETIDAQQVEDIMNGREPRPPEDVSSGKGGDAAGKPKAASKPRASKPKLDTPAGEH